MLLRVALGGGGRGCCQVSLEHCWQKKEHGFRLAQTCDCDPLPPPCCIPISHLLCASRHFPPSVAFRMQEIFFLILKCLIIYWREGILYPYCHPFCGLLLIGMFSPQRGGCLWAGGAKAASRVSVWGVGGPWPLGHLRGWVGASRVPVGVVGHIRKV